jgi:hypothetical protein
LKRLLLSPPDVSKYGLVADYQFNEGGGAIAIDRTRNGHNMAITNGTLTAQGLSIAAGSLGFGEVAYSSLMDFTGAFYVETVINIDVASNSGWLFCKNVDASANAQYGAFWYADEKCIIITLNGTQVYTTPLNSVLNNTPLVVGIGYNMAYAKYTINGVWKSGMEAYSTALTPLTTSLHIANRKPANDRMSAVFHRQLYYNYCPDASVVSKNYKIHKTQQAKRGVVLP